MAFVSKNVIAFPDWAQY